MNIWRNRNERLEEARRARERAEQELRLTQAKTAYYEGLAESLKSLRERNHFGELIASAFKHKEQADES